MFILKLFFELAGIVLKDRDFRQPVLLSDDMKRLLSENIREDINFLAHCNLMVNHKSIQTITDKTFLFF